MKKIFLVLVLAILVVSCKKEYPYPTNDYSTKTDADYVSDGKYITQWGEFLLIDAVMFVDNHETGEKKMFHHFGLNKDTSSLRWGGSIFEIEQIVRNKTTYAFYKPYSMPGNGRLIINGDSTKHYQVYYQGLNKTIIEDPVYGVTQPMMGGSTRPFSGQILNYDEKTVVIQIQEAEGSIDGYNCRYWTQLTLKKTKEW